MKRLWISLALILAVIAITFAGSYHFEGIHKQITERVNEAELAALSADWEHALQHAEDAYRIWDEHSFFIYSTMRHNDADTVFTSLDQAVGCAKIQDEHGFVVAVSGVRSKLFLISENELPSFENIL